MCMLLTEISQPSIVVDVGVFVSFFCSFCSGFSHFFIFFCLMCGLVDFKVQVNENNFFFKFHSFVEWNSYFLFVFVWFVLFCFVLFLFYYY